jgi:hypothetical protein
MLIGANARSTMGSGSRVNAMPAKARPAKSNVVRRLRCSLMHELVFHQALDLPLTISAIFLRMRRTRA